MYRRRYENWVKHFDFIIGDILALLLSSVILFFFLQPGPLKKYSELTLFMSLLSLLVSLLNHSFKNVLKRGMYMEFLKTFHHVLSVILVTTFLMFLFKTGADYSRVFMFNVAWLYFLISYLFRLLWKIVLKKILIKKTTRHLVLVTAMSLLEENMKGLQQNNYGQITLKAIVLIGKPKSLGSYQNIPVFGVNQAMYGYLLEQSVEEVLICSTEPFEREKELIGTLHQMGMVVHQRLLTKTELEKNSQAVDKIGSFLVLTTAYHFASTSELVFKRIIDLLGSILGLSITMLLVLIIGPLIKFQSPGPIFFSQERVGRNGKRFKMYKFRTMYLNAEEKKKELADLNRIKDGRMFKINFDPRIIGNRTLENGQQKTGIMDKIRRYSLDEFPQFWNVLKGEMSLVGTRPPTIEEVEKYDLHHYARLSIKPGLTGLWQVSGRSKIMNFEEVVKLDTEYISQWNIGLDIKILLKTFWVVLRKEGAM